MPTRIGSLAAWPAAAQAVGETCAESLAPEPYHSGTGYDAAFSQEQRNVPPAETERVVRPDGMADHLGWEPMAVVEAGGGFMPPLSTPSGRAVRLG